MKLHEISGDHEADEVYVHSKADIMKALKASLMHDWIIVDMEPHPSHTDTAAEIKELTKIMRAVSKRKKVDIGAGTLSTTVGSSEQLKQLLDGFEKVLGPDDWLWAVTITNWDYDT